VQLSHADLLVGVIAERLDERVAELPVGDEPLLGRC
jgi:hypothetical protein